MTTAIRTEYAFTLPRGFVDAAGTVHRDGTMRLATARDEIEPLRDPAVRAERGVPDRAAALPHDHAARRPARTSRPQVVEGLFAADFDHLQRLYERLNTDGEAVGLGDLSVMRARHSRSTSPRSRTGAWGNDARRLREELFAEAAQLAHRFHWSLDTILDLEHGDRRRFLDESDAILREEREHL